MYELHISNSTNRRFTRRILDAFTHPKISYFNFSFRVQQYIFWFDIPMQRMSYIMDVKQAIENLFKRNVTL